MDSINFDCLKQTDDVCEKHNEKLIKIGNRKAVCISCVKEKVDKKESAIVKKEVERDHKRKTIDVLKKDSIVFDDDILTATFDNFDVTNEETEKAKEQARMAAYQYLDKNNKFNTLLTGTPGTGKSHLAMSILKAVNDNAKEPTSCLFISTNELMRRIKDSFNNKDSFYTENRMIELLSNVDLLVLDDLGSESVFRSNNINEATNYTQNVLFGVLDRRKRTIITTNLNSQELAEIYNEKIVSRICKNLSEETLIKFTTETKDKRLKFDF